MMNDYDKDTWIDSIKKEFAKRSVRHWAAVIAAGFLVGLAVNIALDVKSDLDQPPHEPLNETGQTIRPLQP